MSEEKLYAVKNDEGKSWDFLDSSDSGFWALDSSDCFTTTSKDDAELVADERGGHVVTFVEEPKKVVLSKEQAEIVEDAHDSEIPATFISRHSDGEELLMNAYVNGYTVAKEKKYNVKVPYAVNSYFKKIDANYCIAGYTSIVDLDEDLAQFTESEIEHYGLQDCEKVWCDSDD
ncbi:DUF1642 domain-containing protein [Lacticaseibacillus paracasei]|uniref:DUF1642 domain-containing protein n=1 Tax=Lacticaseibacillus paracasei TaxID=1597 RepID=UPI000D705187|nr:DUF1642 domain-containing protein [Lacticaseibacillus paracasei]AWN84621.1 hypothetical protein LPEG9_11880 [Lacticaseibacillus paracasei]